MISRKYKIIPNTLVIKVNETDYILLLKEQIKKFNYIRHTSKDLTGMLVIKEWKSIYHACKY